jgi:uncharacterized protein (UPF0332 family)
LVEVEYSDIYGQAFKSRNEGDYERTLFPKRLEAKLAMDGAERFIKRIEKLSGEQK